MDSKNAFPWRTLFVSVLISCGGSFHAGYQATVMNPTERIFHEFINETTVKRYGIQLSDDGFRTLWSWILNMTLLGNIIGTLPLRYISEKWGRRKPLYMSSILILIGLIMQAISKTLVSYELMTFGRFITGIGCGFSLALEGVYLNEISPTKWRGLFCSMTGSAVQLGFVFGVAMAVQDVFGTAELWPFAFVVEMIPTVILMLALRFIQESPRFLYMHGLTDQCKSSLSYFGHWDVEGTVLEIKYEMKSQQGGMGYRDVWSKIYLRKACWLGSIVVTASSMSGITYINFFSTAILQDVGLRERTAQYATLGIFLVFFISTFVGSFLINYVGRRPLLLFTLMAIIVINCALMVFGILYDSHGVKWAGYASLGACLLFAVAFGVAISHLQFAITCEMIPLNARLVVQLIVMMVQKFATLFAGVVFYPLQGAVGAYCFLIYIVPLVLIWIVLLKQLPETKQKSVIDVMKELGYQEQKKSEDLQALKPEDMQALKFAEEGQHDQNENQ